MGCGKTRQMALDELKEVYEILQLENQKLTEEKENLLRDQIDKPSDDKEIQQSMKGMTIEISDNYAEARAMLEDFLSTITFQYENSPERRIYNMFEMRHKLEETYRRIENSLSQKQTYIKLNQALMQAIEKETAGKGNLAEY